jgi:membrane fusion protein (multidrug efflux system)
VRRETMNHRRMTTMLLGLLLLTASIVMLVGCGREEAARTTNDERVPVEVVEVERSQIAPTLSYSGTIEPWRKALLGAQIQGPVERLHVDVGDRVAKGDLLAELASEQLTQATAAYTAAEKDWRRMKTLFEKDAVTERAFDQADAGYQAAKATYDMVLESARIRAPFAGVISGRFLDEGEVFVLMPSGAGAPAILEISKTDTVKVVIEVAERERPVVRTGLPATVAVDNHTARTFEGRIRRIDPDLDRMSRTSTAEIVVANPDGALRSGAFAEVTVGLAPREALLLPRDALVRQEGTGVFYVYVLEDGTARRRDLVLGGSYGADVEVLEGLSSGERVVTAGRYRLHDGAVVTVAAGRTPAPAPPPGGGVTRPRRRRKGAADEPTRVRGAPPHHGVHALHRGRALRRACAHAASRRSHAFVRVPHGERGHPLSGRRVGGHRGERHRDHRGRAVDDQRR